MDLLWLWPWLVVAAVAVVVFLVVREIGESASGRGVRRFACPATGEEVSATFASDFLNPQRYLDVHRCSRLPGERPPACDKACLQRGKEAIEAEDLRRRPLPLLPLA